MRKPKAEQVQLDKETNGMRRPSVTNSLISFVQMSSLSSGREMCLLAFGTEKTKTNSFDFHCDLEMHCNKYVLYHL